MMVHGRRGVQPLIDLPFIADIMRDRHPLIVIQKSAQVGATEMLVHLALHAADTSYAGRGRVLFLMPTQNVMDDFSQARFDDVIQSSAYLRERLQPEPPRRKGADRLRLKHIGPGYIFLRGADSPRQLASVDADIVIADEFDQMGGDVLAAMRRRIASSRAGRIIVASTPRFPEAGINALYRQSDRRRYYLPCPACDLAQPLTFADNIDVARALIVCRGCRAPMDVRARGRWVAEAPANTAIHGYHLNRLYSPWVNVPALIEASTAVTPSDLQRFQNEDLGETFVPPGGGLTLDEIDRCRRTYSLQEYAGQECVMGIDVGTKLHVVIRELPPEDFRWGMPRLWYAGMVSAFEELDALWSQFNVQGAVIDNLPETRKASEFVMRHSNAWLARYDRHDRPHEAEYGYPNVYHVNRTEALDEMFERFRRGVAELPSDARSLGGRVKDGLGEYVRELLAPQRTLEPDFAGNLVARWVEHGRADHFAHAEAYAMLAEKFGRLATGFYDPGPDEPRDTDQEPWRKIQIGSPWGRF